MNINPLVVCSICNSNHLKAETRIIYGFVVCMACKKLVEDKNIPDDLKMDIIDVIGRLDEFI